MKLSYDPRYNIAYIRLREKTAEVETIRVSDELNVDLAPDGTVYGIELLNANEQLRAATMAVSWSSGPTARSAGARLAVALRSAR